MTKKMKKSAAEAKPLGLAELCDEASELSSDLGYSLLEVERAGVSLPPYLSGRTDSALRAACAELANLVDEADKLLPRKQAPGRPPAGGREFLAPAPHPPAPTASAEA
jgi:hypothetical protein